MGAKTFRQLTKAREQPRQNHLIVMKSDDDKRLVFGWANVAVRIGGEQIIDWQEDAIDTEDLEKAALRIRQGRPRQRQHGKEARIRTCCTGHRRGIS